MSAVVTELTSGGVAGCAGILATQPLDTIRIRLQTCPTSLGLSRPFTGILDCARVTVGKEGVHGLYKGAGSQSLTIGARNALIFFSYEFVGQSLARHTAPKEHVGPSTPNLSQVFTAGCAAGVVGSLITGPTELVKCIAQTNVQNQGRMVEEWHILRNLVQDHGLFGAQGPCRGLFTTMVRDVPSFGLYFMCYEACVRRYGKSKFSCFMSGGLAGTISWAVVYPVDVIKTRWTTAKPHVYKSIGHCVKDTLAQPGGWRTLFRGFGATMARAWPQNGVVFLTYDVVKGALPKGLTC